MLVDYFESALKRLGGINREVGVGRGGRFLGNAGRAVSGILGGWQLTGSAGINSGQPFTVQTSNVNLNLGDSTRPNRLGSGVQSDISGAGRRGVDYPWFNLSDFERVPACESRTTCVPSPNGYLPFGPGTSGRNILDGPGLAFINPGLLKNFTLADRGRIQARLEVFNLLNHPNFMLPVRIFDAQNGGIIRGVQGSGRGGPRTLRYQF